MRASLPPLLLVVALFVAGCGTRTAQVEGTVVYADAPDTPAADLTDYVITFESAGEGKPVGGTGIVGRDGTFRMSTFGEGDGALRGPQRVALTPPISNDGSMAPSKILPKYHDLKTSGLVVDVGSGVNQVKLVVERKPRLRSGPRGTRSKSMPWADGCRVGQGFAQSHHPGVPTSGVCSAGCYYWRWDCAEPCPTLHPMPKGTSPTEQPEVLTPPQ